jgi:hypothetical protein
MKNFLKYVLMAGIVIALVLWWSPDLRRQAKSLLRDTGVTSNSTTLYKWRNAQGVWQYTQDPPSDGVAYEKVETRSDVNVLPLPDQLKSGD